MTPACTAAANAAPRSPNPSLGVSVRPGRILTTLILALLVLDGIAKLLNVPALAPVTTLLELVVSVVSFSFERIIALFK